MDVSARLNDEDTEALSLLMGRYRLNKADALRKALQIAVKGTESDRTFGDAASDIIRLMLLMNESQKQILRYAAQAAIFSGNLATQAGLKEASSEAYREWKTKNEGSLQ